jgi:DNA-directed RNA polymerase subunit RPC12/RpoP
MWSDSVQCPYCDYAIKDLWDYEWHSADEIGVDCPSCGNPVLIKRNVYIDYDISKDEG